MENKTMEKINEALKSNATEVVEFLLTNEELEKFSEHFERRKLVEGHSTRDKVCLTTLDGNKVTIKNINTREIRKDFFNKVDEFMMDEDENSFLEFPGLIEASLEDNKELLPYLSVIGKDLKRMANKAHYRGYISATNGEDDNFMITKRFIAKYELLIFNKSNKPYAKITRLSKEYSLYKPNSKNYITEEMGSVTCLYKNLYRFLECNDISDSDVVISKKSIDKFYAFDDTFFVTPTEKWVNKWWNYDCPRLYKYVPNVNGTTNMWGLGLICWQNLLVESTWNYTEVDENITNEEVLAFAKDREHTAIFKQMQNVIRAREMSDEDKQRKIKKAENIEKEIQKIINKNEKEILLSTMERMERYVHCDSEAYLNKDSNIEEIKNELRNLDGKMGLDCGFLYMKLSNGDDLFKEIAEYDKDNYRSKDGSMKLNYPLFVQSTTIKKEMAAQIKRIVEASSNYRLSYWTVLD